MDARNNQATNTGEQGQQTSDFGLLHGSDIEIADLVLKMFRRNQELSGLHPEIISDEGRIYRFNGECWSALDLIEVYRMIHSVDGEKPATGGPVKLSHSRCKSILETIQIRCARKGFFANPPIGITCMNGFVAFDSEGNARLEEHSPEQRSRHRVQADWHAEYEWDWQEGKWVAPLLTKLLTGSFKEAPDMQARINLIGELCGCAALGIATHLLKQPKAVILHGMKANNGKSQLLSIIKGLLPSGAITAIAPQRFEDDNQIARLAGVHLNAASELGNSTAIVADRFKAIVTGDPVDVRPVYRDPITVQPTALHVYATNVLPPFTGGFDRGVRRRLLVLEFDRTIPEEEMMPDLGARIVDEEAEALIAFAVRGASRVIRNGALTEPASSAESLRQWITGTDPVLGWLDECAEFEEGAVVSQRTARENCLAWAVKEGFDRGRFPGARTFAQRVLAADGRIKRGRTRAEGRVFYGLKITQYDDPVHEVAAAMEPGG